MARAAVCLALARSGAAAVLWAALSSARIQPVSGDPEQPRKQLLVVHRCSPFTRPVSRSPPEGKLLPILHLAPAGRPPEAGVRLSLRHGQPQDHSPLGTPFSSPRTQVRGARTALLSACAAHSLSGLEVSVKEQRDALRATGPYVTGGECSAGSPPGTALPLSAGRSSARARKSPRPLRVRRGKPSGA